MTTPYFYILNFELGSSYITLTTKCQQNTFLLLLVPPNRVKTTAERQREREGGEERVGGGREREGGREKEREGERERGRERERERERERDW